MPAPAEIAKTVFDRLPSSAQRTTRGLLERGATRRAVHDQAVFLARVDAAVGGFNGRRVVEVGSDNAATSLRAVAEMYEPRELIGLNPAVATRTITDRVEMHGVPAEASGLDDESVDAVFSSSAFEHIHDLPGVLEEMHRVLVPGGLLFSHFGPVWSSSYGHHLWVVDQRRLLNYHTVVLPVWAHLLSTPDEVRALLEPEHGPELADRMTRFVFSSDEQNQLFFDDYERIVAESPFETVFLKGYDAPELAALYPGAVSPAVLDELQQRFPDRHGFLYDGVTLLLRKR